MKTLSRRIALAALVIPALGLGTFMAVSTSRAQDEAKVEVTGTRSGAAGDLMLQDKQLAQCLVLHAQNEIALATFAADRAESPAVKAFAEKMATEHAKCVTSLTPIAGNLPGLRGNAPREDAAAPRREKADTTAGVDLMDFQQELAKKCLATTQGELSKKEGAEFDQCFMMQQVAAHLGMHDAITVTMNHAGPELKQELTDASQKVEEHLAEAKKLVEGMENQVARRKGAAAKAK